MKRNLSVEVIKFLFAISIAMGHYSSTVMRSDIVVLLFFVLSGYFLVNSFDTGKYKNAWQYSFSRLKRIYPYYFFAFIVLFVFVNRVDILNPIKIVSAFFKSLPELFLLQNVGVFPGGINYPLWQLCTLFVASHVLFALLLWDRQITINVICPMIFLSTFTYFANIFDSGDPNSWGVEYLFIYMPLLRAFASLGIGMFVNYPVKKILNKLEVYFPTGVNHLHGLSEPVSRRMRTTLTETVPLN